MLLYIEMEAGGSTQPLRLVLEDDGSETIEGIKQMIHTKQGTNVGGFAASLAGVVLISVPLHYCAVANVCLIDRSNAHATPHVQRRSP